MERRFSIEAKSFRFSSKEGSSLFRLEERRKKFVGYVFVSPQSSSWLIDTVEEACLVKENIAKSFREGDKALMVHGGDNKSGRFLEVAVFAEGGRKGGLWLPEGRDGRGWRRFAAELRILLAPSEGGPVESELKFHPSPSSKPAPTKVAEVGAIGVGPKDRTYAEVLQVTPRSRVEAKNLSKGRAAGAGKGWVNQVLGFFQLGLGRIVTGLLESILVGPEDFSAQKRVRAVLKCLKAFKGWWAGPFLLTNSGRRYGLRKVKLGHMGCYSKSNRALRIKPRWKKPLATENSSLAVGLVPFSHLAVEGCLGASIVDPSLPERVFGESPPFDGELELSMSPAFEGCLGTSVVGCPAGDGPSSGVEPFSPVSSGEFVVHSSGTPLVSEGGLELGATAVLNSGHGPSSVESPLLSVQVLDENTSAQGDGSAGDAMLSAPGLSVPGECSGPSKNHPFSPEPSGSVDSSEPQPVPKSQPLVNGLTEAQAWFFGWMRHGGRHHEKLLAAVDRFEKQTRKDNEVAPPPDCSMELPQMKAVLEAAMRDVDSGVITTEAGSKIGTDIGVRVGCL
jgi:hypothetical protein